MVNASQVYGEEDDGHHRNDRGVFNFSRGGPRIALHDCAHIAQELPGTSEKTRSGAVESTLAAYALALNTLAKTGGARGGNSRRNIRRTHPLRRRLRQG